MDVVVNRLDVTVLKILAQEKCFDEISGMTINEINAFYGEDDLLTTRHNLGVRIRRLVQAGYMEEVNRISAIYELEKVPEDEYVSCIVSGGYELWKDDKEQMEKYMEDMNMGGF